LYVTALVVTGESNQVIEVDPDNSIVVLVKCWLVWVHTVVESLNNFKSKALFWFPLLLYVAWLTITKILLEELVGVIVADKPVSA
jgi:hypothetical protein